MGYSLYSVAAYVGSILVIDMLAVLGTDVVYDFPLYYEVRLIVSAPWRPSGNSWNSSWGLGEFGEEEEEEEVRLGGRGGERILCG